MNKSEPADADRDSGLYQRNRSLEEKAARQAIKISGLQAKLEKAELSIAIEKSRRINRLLSGLKGFITPGDKKNSLSTLLGIYKKEKVHEQTGANTTHEEENHYRLMLGSKLPYPNLRALSVAAVPTFTGAIDPIIVDANWQKSLRPGLDSVDLVIFELPADEASYPHKTSEEIIDKADAFSIPSIVVVSSHSQFSSKLAKKAQLIIAKDSSIYDESIKTFGTEKSHLLRLAIDIRTHNPIGWMYEPLFETALFIEKLTDDDVEKDALEILKTSGIKIDVVFSPKPMKHLQKAKHFPATSLDDNIIQESKKYRVTVCLSSQFENAETLRATILKLLANGTHVITDDDVLVSKIDVAHLHLIKESAKKRHDLINDLDQRERASIIGRRKILDASSISAVTDELFKKCNVKTDFPRKISVIMSTNRPDYIDHAIENVRKQSYPEKELILVLHGNGFDKKSIEKSLESSDLKYKIVEAPSSLIFGEALNKGLDASTGYYVTKFDDDDEYGEHHLQDLALAHHYSGAHVVGKWGHFVYLKNSEELLHYQSDKQERFVGHLPGGTFLITRSLLAEFRFGRVKNAIDSELWDRLKQAGATLYSANRYNYIRIRHGDNTWQEKDDFFKNKSSKNIQNTSTTDTAFL